MAGWTQLASALGIERRAGETREEGFFSGYYALMFAAFPVFALSTSLGYRLVPILLVLASFVVLARRRATWNPAMTAWAWALLILSLPHYFSVLVSASDASVMERVSYGWLFLAVGAAALRYSPSAQPVLYALVVGAATTFGAQLLQGGDRPSMHFNPIPYAEVAAGLFCLACVAVTAARRWWQLAVGVLGLLLWIGVIILTEARGALLATLPGVLYLAWFAARYCGRKVSILALMALVLCLLVAEILSGKVITHRFQVAAQEYQQYQRNPERASSTAIRLELYRAATLVAREHPFGLGEENARAKALEWVDQGRVRPYVRSSLEVAHFHSDIFQSLAVAGYPGLVCLLLFYGFLAVFFLRHRDQLVARMALVFIASFIVSGLTDVPLHNRLTLFALFTVLTFCFVHLNPQRRRAASHDR
ncbi:O-antigen ligase family protein [Marinimicrobium alkaliphilum]|uniref:O-antigen ligase family protein n=1 Tax=Marinimicrobium alkaliphilum TaxID=2202654 RepID=UPI000DB9D4A9|nr:O-antigen ligase family protein [Marinimicrobium alkaliphilum]